MRLGSGKRSAGFDGADIFVRVTDTIGEEEELCKAEVDYLNWIRRFSMISLRRCVKKKISLVVRSNI